MSNYKGCQAGHSQLLFERLLLYFNIQMLFIVTDSAVVLKQSLETTLDTRDVSASIETFG